MSQNTTESKLNPINKVVFALAPVIAALGWTGFIWTEGGNEFLSPFIIAHDLNMGSTYNLVSSQAFLLGFRLVHSVGAIAAGAVVARGILKA